MKQSTFRRYLRDKYFSVVAKTFATETGRQILAAALQGNLAAFDLSRLDLSYPQSYPGPCQQSFERDISKAPIFVTSRFRSGSTLLWNIFRHIGGMTTFYEPLNESLGLSEIDRRLPVDSTHLMVSDYWREYDERPYLTRLYDARWIERSLFMDTTHDDPALNTYITNIIRSTDARALLQFNRIDFRLPWIRQNYPTAVLIHLYRNPRNQWVSTLPKHAPCPQDCDIDAYSQYDGFYLRTWVQDLKYNFPILDPAVVRHPYRLSYLVWRLSHAFGQEYCDYSIAYEDLTDEPRKSIESLLGYLDTEAPIAKDLLGLVVKQDHEKWRNYANHDWFCAHETWCEERLNRLSTNHQDS